MKIEREFVAGVTALHDLFDTASGRSIVATDIRWPTVMKLVSDIAHASDELLVKQATELAFDGNGPPNRHARTLWSLVSTELELRRQRAAKGE